MAKGNITSIFINSGLARTEGDSQLIEGLAQKEKEADRQYEPPRGNLRIYGREL